MSTVKFLIAITNKMPASQDVKDTLTVDSGSIRYSASAEASHASLIAADSWTIQDGRQT